MAPRLTSRATVYPATYRRILLFVCSAVLQEALHNAVKHSGLRHFAGRLWATGGDSSHGQRLRRRLGPRNGKQRGWAWSPPHAGAAESEGEPFHRLATQAGYHNPRSRCTEISRYVTDFHSPRLTAFSSSHPLTDSRQANLESLFVYEEKTKST